MKLNPKTLMLATVLPLLAAHGCDDKATKIAREAADRQAQQNTAMADLNKEVASGTHKLVEADAQALWRQGHAGDHGRGRWGADHPHRARPCRGEAAAGDRARA